MRWQKFITSIWEKIVANKKGVDIFPKHDYKNWYNRKRLCKQTIPVVFFISMKHTRWRQTGGFLLLHFVF